MKDWISHVKAFAKKHDISYRDALRHPHIRDGYTRQRTTKGRGTITSDLMNRTITPLNEDIYNTLVRFVNCGINMRRNAPMRHPTDAELLSHLLDTLLINSQIHTRRGLNVHNREDLIKKLASTLNNTRLLERYCEQVLQSQFDVDAPYYEGMNNGIVQAQAHYA